MTSKQDWFKPDSPGKCSDALQAFVDAVRDSVTDWQAYGLQPQDTSLAIRSGTIGLQVPGMTSPVHHLYVEYGGPGKRTYMRGDWSDDYPFEGTPDRDLSLFVIGVKASPRKFGKWAGAWLDIQLRQPVIRNEWLDSAPAPHQSVTLRRWDVGDDEGFDYRGSLLGRFFMKRPPDRTITERPDRRT